MKEVYSLPVLEQKSQMEASARLVSSVVMKESQLQLCLIARSSADKLILQTHPVSPSTLRPHSESFSLCRFTLSFLRVAVSVPECLLLGEKEDLTPMTSLSMRTASYRIKAHPSDLVLTTSEKTL